MYRSHCLQFLYPRIRKFNLRRGQEWASIQPRLQEYRRCPEFGQIIGACICSSKHSDMIKGKVSHQHPGSLPCSRRNPGKYVLGQTWYYPLQGQWSTSLRPPTKCRSNTVTVICLAVWLGSMCEAEAWVGFDWIWIIYWQCGIRRHEVQVPSAEILILSSQRIP